MQNWSGKSKGWNASTTSWKHAFDGQNQPEVNELNSARPLDAVGVKGAVFFISISLAPRSRSPRAAEKIFHTLNDRFSQK